MDPKRTNDPKTTANANESSLPELQFRIKASRIIESEENKGEFIISIPFRPLDEYQLVQIRRLFPNFGEVVLSYLDKEVLFKSIIS